MPELLLALPLEKLSPAEGAEFLRQRAGRETLSQTERQAAEAFSQRVDGLLLALDQAGAYLEDTGVSVSDYATLYEALTNKKIEVRCRYLTFSRH